MPAAIRIASLSLIAGLIATTFAATAAAQDFNCRSAREATERAICGSPHLRALDDRMAGLYYRVLAIYSDPDAFSADEPHDLRAEQRRFLAERNACGTSWHCIEGAYAAQLSQLRRRLELARPG
jgi:uncharacterized protein